MEDTQTRPSRSRANAACVKCRERKSRCKLEADSTTCLNCRIYGTECVFIGEATATPPPREPRLTSIAEQIHRSRLVTSPLPPDGGTVLSAASVSPSGSSRKRRRGDSIITPQPDPEHRTIVVQPSEGLPSPVDVEGSKVSQSQPTPTSVYDKDQDNAHIVDPANTNDTQVLTTYLSSVHGNSPGMRLMRIMPTTWSRSVMFTPVKNRTFGKNRSGGLAFEKLYIMEQMIGENAEPLVVTFFDKANICMPLLDHETFVAQYRNSKDKTSPALLACLYANSRTYWTCSPHLRQVKPPDHNFLWSLASDALYAELHTAPGISTIIALLLDLGGRPTTSLIANGVLMGSTVSLAYSLGLNRNPLQWEMPEGEKLLRMKIWWALLIQDTWLSLAYGTPSHIQLEQCDVPVPEASFFSGSNQRRADTDAIAVYVALSGLTRVLAHYLKYLYHIHDDQSKGRSSIQSLKLELNQWVDTLRPDMRRIITRGNNLATPGAANLRLCYLSMRFLLCRLKLDQDRARKDTDHTHLDNRYLQVQSSAEDIIIFTQELEDRQVNDFWLPMSAFTFTSVTTALLRSFVETKGSQTSDAPNTSLQLAWDLIRALRSHRDRVEWDLGDHCLQQYSSVVEQLIEEPGTELDSFVFPGFDGVTLDDALAFDGEFANLWEIAPPSASIP